MKNLTTPQDTLPIQEDIQFDRCMKLDIELMKLVEQFSSSRKFRYCKNILNVENTYAESITYTISGRTVTITGVADSTFEREAAAWKAWDTPGIDKVINNISLGHEFDLAIA